jgi:DNA-binding phage protein
MKKTSLQKARTLGYTTSAQLQRELMRDKKFRTLWETRAAERAIRFAIIQKRIEKRLTQAAVAKKARMHQSAVARLESGEGSPTLETVSRVLAALDAKISVS